MIFPKNGGSVDAIDHFFLGGGECSSKVIFLREWRLRTWGSRLRGRKKWGEYTLA